MIMLYVFQWAELMDLGKQGDDALLQARIKAQAPNKCCTLIYTVSTPPPPFPPPTTNTPSQFL